MAATHFGSGPNVTGAVQAGFTPTSTHFPNPTSFVPVNPGPRKPVAATPRAVAQPAQRAAAAPRQAAAAPRQAAAPTNTSVQETQTNFGNSTQTGTNRAFLDIPTPEEFLDNFQNALATHVQNLIQGGGLSKNAAAWVMKNPSSFLNNYTAKLGQMAQSGQQIFKGTIGNGPTTLLGTRMGNGGTTVTNGTQNGQNTRVTSDTTPSASVGAPLAGSPAPVGGQAMTNQMTPAGQVNSTPYGNAVSTVGGGAAGAGDTRTTTTNTTTNNNQTTNMTEELYGRPNATALHTYAPLQFMKDTMSPDSINIMYEGEKGANNLRPRLQSISGGATTAAGFGAGPQ